jgi:hypothetical protein
MSEDGASRSGLVMGTARKSHQAMHMQTKGAIFHMIYYRIALQSEHSPSWYWRSSTLTSVSSLLDVLKAYAHIPRAAIRVFFASSPVYMDEMLTRANDGLGSSFVTVEQLLRQGHMSLAEIRRWELELHGQGDHDSPYVFTLPTSMPQVLAWMKLLARVRNGELTP